MRPRIALSELRAAISRDYLSFLVAEDIPLAYDWTSPDQIPSSFLPQFLNGLQTAVLGGVTVYRSELYVIVSLDGRRIVVGHRPVSAEVRRLALVSADYVDLDA